MNAVAHAAAQGWFESLRLAWGAWLSSPGAGFLAALGAIGAGWFAYRGVQRRIDGDRQLANEARTAEAVKDREHDAREREKAREADARERAKAREADARERAKAREADARERANAREADARIRWWEAYNHLWVERSVLPPKGLAQAVQALCRMVTTEQQKAMAGVFVDYLIAETMTTRDDWDKPEVRIATDSRIILSEKGDLPEGF